MNLDYLKLYFMENSMETVIKEIYFEAMGNVSALVHSIESCISNGAKSLLIMSCDNDLLPQDIDNYLQSIPVPVFGGIFPKLPIRKKSMIRVI